MDYRIILYHKQSTSARTRFVKFSYNSVCAFEPIPKLAQSIETIPENTVLLPSMVLKEAEEKLELEKGLLKAEGGYCHAVEVPGGSIQVILAAINTIDPPFEWAEKIDANFVDLTQARGLPPIELELLRHAYELILGG